VGRDTIETEIRERLRGMIEAVVEEELEGALGAGRSQRVGEARTGYRHGACERQLATSLGRTSITLPRARLKGADGAESEWHSRIIPRGAPSGWTGHFSAHISAASTRDGCAALYRRCCAEHLYRRMRYLAWSGGYVMSSTHGRRAIWRPKRSATYLWTVGIRVYGSEKSALAYRSWHLGRMRRWPPHSAGYPDCGSGK